MRFAFCARMHLLESGDWLTERSFRNKMGLSSYQSRLMIIALPVNEPADLISSAQSILGRD